MFQKTLLIVGISALACGLAVGSASAKQKHHVKHVAAAPKAEPMKATPGNNPFPVVASSETDRSKYGAPKSYIGNNPMSVPAK
jgi:hypothetical protein